MGSWAAIAPAFLIYMSDYTNTQFNIMSEEEPVLNDLEKKKKNRRGLAVRS